MKHNTHIYLAAKGIEFLHEGLYNLHYATTQQLARKTTIKKYREQGKDLQELLMQHQDMIKEASWAPDSILSDMAQYHTFKLFTEQDFPGDSAYAKQVYETHTATKKYYRASGSGGLPYKIDHLARVISDMNKLRKYNDRCSMNQIMYQYLLISHYIADAHVPMHCDIRDDPPSPSDTNKPGNGIYYSDTEHRKIEKIWENAVDPVATDEGIIRIRNKDQKNPPDPLSATIKFNVTNKSHCDEIIPHVIPNDNLMQYMIDLCIKSKERSLQLFPVQDPTHWSPAVLQTMTRDIFADVIGNLITVWIWIWRKST